MACLDNYILVKGHCAGVTPTSGLYINQNLPGITIEKAAGTAEGVFTQGITLLNQCITNGIARTRQMLINAMLGRVRFNQLISGGRYGVYQPDDFDDDAKYLSGVARARGIKAELRDNCKLSDIYIPRVAVIGKGTNGTKTLRITDGVTNTDYTFTFVNQALTWIETRQLITSDLAFITINDSNFQPLDTQLNYSGSCGFCANDCSCDSDCGCNTGLNIWGYDSSGAVLNSQTFGILPVVQVKCSSDRFFCELSNLEMVAWACLYAAGVDFLNYNLISNRLNVYTIYGEEDGVRMMESWEQKFQELLQTITKTLPTYLNTIDSCCLTCDASTWEYGVP